MDKHPGRRWFVLAALLPITSGCASGGGTTGNTEAVGGAGGVSIQVTNDLVPPSAVTVWIAPETGSRRRLGTIQPNGQLTFTFSPVSPSMDHRIVAEYEGGRSVTSNPFSLQGVRTARWRLGTPVVSVER